MFYLKHAFGCDLVFTEGLSIRDYGFGFDIYMVAKWNDPNEMVTYVK